MRNSSQFVTLLFLAFLNLCFFEATAQTTSLKYKVQVGAFRNPSAVSFKNLYDIGDVYAEEVGNGLTRIVLGYYADRKTAATVLVKAKKKGYKDAFIGLNKANIKKENIAQKSTPKKTTPPKPKKEEKTTKSTPPKPKKEDKKQTSLKKNQEYIIDLGQFDQLTSIPKLGIINSLGDVYVQRMENSNRVLVGTFKDRKKANEALAKARKAGFKTAGLRVLESSGKDSLGNKVKLEEETTTTSNPPLLIYEGKKNSQTNSAMIALAVAEANRIFVPLTFTVFNADIYDPNLDLTAEPIVIADNEILKGQQIPENLIGLFNKTWRNAADDQYFAVGRYSLTPHYEAYLIRKGKANAANNQLTMYIYDKENQRLGRQELLSSSVASNGMKSRMKSWLIDMNNDGQPDILSHYTEEYTTTTGQMQKNKRFTAKVWLNGKYVDAQIVNEDALENQLGL